MGKRRQESRIFDDAVKITRKKVSARNRKRVAKRVKNTFFSRTSPVAASDFYWYWTINLLEVI